MKYMKVEEHVCGGRKEWRKVKLFRCVLLLLTGGSLLLGLVLLIVGFVMISGYNVFLDFITGSYKESAVGILVMGVIVVCISSLGFYAALKSHSYTMAIFLICMVLAIICELLASATIQLTKEKSQDLGMQKKLRNYIHMYGSDSFKDQTDAWDLIQTELECCGLAGVEDYANSTFLSQTGQLPRSCCGPLQIVDSRYIWPDIDKIEPCRKETASRYQTGCLLALKSLFSSKDVVFGVIAVVGSIMQTTIIVGATVLVNKWKLPGYSFPCLPRLLGRLNQKPANHIV